MRTERLLRADGIIYGNVNGYYEDKHTYTFVINRKNKSLSSYFDVYFEINHYEGDIKIMEPNKCKDLVWFNINNLPFDMIDFEKRAIENYLNNIFFDCDYANNEITIEDIKK